MEAGRDAVRHAPLNLAPDLGRPPYALEVGLYTGDTELRHLGQPQRVGMIAGAQPLKRAIEQHLQDPLALALLEGNFRRGDTIVADVEDEKIVLRKEEPGEAVA